MTQNEPHKSFRIIIGGKNRLILLHAPLMYSNHKSEIQTTYEKKKK